MWAGVAKSVPPYAPVNDVEWRVRGRTASDARPDVFPNSVSWNCLADWPAKGAADEEVAVAPAMRWWWWWSLCSRDACLLAAAMGQPDKLRCVLRLVLTWPRPLQPGVGHFRIVSCIARTKGHGQQNHPIRFDLSINNLYIDTKTCMSVIPLYRYYSLLAPTYLEQSTKFIDKQSKLKHKKRERNKGAGRE